MADDNSNNVLAGLAGLQGLAGLGSAWSQSEAMNAQAAFTVSMAKINQQLAGYRAADVIRQGDMQANRIRQQGQQVLGSQRASAAAQNIRVDDGSAQDAELETKELTADDQVTARNNAWREAYGIQMQAQQNVNAARMQQGGARVAAAGTLLGGGLQALQAGSKINGYLTKSGRTQSNTLLGQSPIDSSTLNYSQQLKMPGEDNDQFNSWWRD